MEFIKKKTDTEGVTTGHWFECDDSILATEISSALNWKEGKEFGLVLQFGNTLTVVIYIESLDTPENWKAIEAIIVAHGSQEQVDARAKQAAIDVIDAETRTAIREKYSQADEYKAYRLGFKNGTSDPFFLEVTGFIEKVVAEGKAKKAAL